MLFEDIKLQVIYYGSHRKLTPPPPAYFSKISFITQVIWEHGSPLKKLEH